MSDRCCNCMDIQNGTQNVKVYEIILRIVTVCMEA